MSSHENMLHMLRMPVPDDAPTRVSVVSFAGAVLLAAAVGFACIVLMPVWLRQGLL